MVGEVTDNDVHISLDDQKMINRFARQNQKLEEIKDELKVTSEDWTGFRFIFNLFQTASTEIDTLGDCSADVEELALTAEDGVTIPYVTWWGSSLLWKNLTKYRPFWMKESKFFPSSSSA